jgi:DNA-binding transcriptional MerR regulator
LWASELSDSPLPQAFSFHDLLEVRVVHAFRRYGVSLPTIRKACQHARDYFKRPYPFTCQRFLTDGRAVLAEILKQAGEAKDTRPAHPEMNGVFTFWAS